MQEFLKFPEPHGGVNRGLRGRRARGSTGQGIELHDLFLCLTDGVVAIKRHGMAVPLGNTTAASALVLLVSPAIPIGKNIARPRLHACEPSVTIAWAPASGPSSREVLTESPRRVRRH
jgi:hypothetical protein